MLPGPRHAGVARAMGVLRHLPLPASRRLAWMLAGLEASRGRTGEAQRVLDGSRHARDPWSRFLRARLAADPIERRALLREALELDPALFAAWISLAELRAGAGDLREGERCLARAAELRPWDRRVRAELDAIRRALAAPVQPR